MVDIMLVGRHVCEVIDSHCQWFRHCCFRACDLGFGAFGISKRAVWIRNIYMLTQCFRGIWYNRIALTQEQLCECCGLGECEAGGIMVSEHEALAERSSIARLTQQLSG